MNPTEQLGALRSPNSSQRLELEIGKKKRVRGIFDHGFLSGGVVAGTSDSSVMHISGEFIQIWIYVALTIWIRTHCLPLNQDTRKVTR